MRKKPFLLVLTSASLLLLIFLPFAGRTQKAINADQGRTERTNAKTNQNLYEELYHARVVSDLAMCTALLKRIEAGEIATVKGVIQTWVDGDLLYIASATNHQWSPGQAKAINAAKAYRSKDKGQ